MTVRRHNSRDYWEIDVRRDHPEKPGEEVRVRRKAKRQTKKGAQKEERRIHQQIDSGEWFEDDSDIPTVGEVGDRWIEMARETGALAESTIQGYEPKVENYIKPECGELPVDEVTVEQFENLYVDGISRGHARKTILNTLSAFRSLIKYARKLGHLDRVPEFEIPDKNNTESRKDAEKEKSVPEHLTESQASKMLENAHERVYPLVFLGLHTGMRLGEMLALSWEHVRVDKDLIEVRWNWTHEDLKRPKSNAGKRDIPLTSDLREFLESYREDWTSEGLFEGHADWLFQREDGTLWTHSFIKRPIRYSYEDAGLWDEFDTHGFHLLRHTFATKLVDAGVPIVHIQRLMGHADYSTTLKYVHEDESAHRDTMKQVEGFAL